MGQKLHLTLEDIVKKLKANCNKEDFIYVLSELFSYAINKYGDSFINTLEPVIDEMMEKAKLDDSDNGLVCSSTKPCLEDGDENILYSEKTNTINAIADRAMRGLNLKIDDDSKTVTAEIPNVVFAPYLPVNKR